MFLQTWFKPSSLIQSSLVVFCLLTTSSSLGLEISGNKLFWVDSFVLSFSLRASRSSFRAAGFHSKPTQVARMAKAQNGEHILQHHKQSPLTNRERFPSTPNSSSSSELDSVSEAGGSAWNRQWPAPSLGFFLWLSPDKPINALSSLLLHLLVWGEWNTHSWVARFVCTWCPITLELPSRARHPGPKPPGHSHPGVKLTRCSGNKRLETRGQQNSRMGKVT